MKCLKYVCVFLLTLSLFACGQSKPNEDVDPANDKIELTDTEKIAYDMILTNLNYDGDGISTLTESAFLNAKFISVTIPDGDSPSSYRHSFVSLHDNSYCWISGHNIYKGNDYGITDDPCQSMETLLGEEDTFTEETSNTQLIRVDHEKLIAYYKQEYPDGVGSGHPGEVTLTDLEMYTYQEMAKAGYTDDLWPYTTRITLALTDKDLSAAQSTIIVTSGEFCLSIADGYAVDASDMDGDNMCEISKEFMGNATEQEAGGIYYYAIDPQRIVDYIRQSK